MGSRRLLALATVLLPTAMAVPAAAQSERPGSLRRSFAGAVVGGGAGFALGLVIGVGARGGSNANEGEFLEGAVYGSLAGQTLGMAFGAWKGNGSRGFLPVDIVIGAATLVVGIAATENDVFTGTDFFLVTLAQLTTVVATEQLTSAWRRSPSVGASPAGSPAITYRLRF